MVTIIRKLSILLVLTLLISSCNSVSKQKYPDSETIKNDLIGVHTETWKFDFLSEFVECEIVNWTEGKDRIEAELKIKLEDAYNKDLSKMEAIVAYVWRENKWKYHRIAVRKHETIKK